MTLGHLTSPVNHRTVQKEITREIRSVRSIASAVEMMKTALELVGSLCKGQDTGSSVVLQCLVKETHVLSSETTFCFRCQVLAELESKEVSRTIYSVCLSWLFGFRDSFEPHLPPVHQDSSSLKLASVSPPSYVYLTSLSFSSILFLVLKLRSIFVCLSQLSALPLPHPCRHAHVDTHKPAVAFSCLPRQPCIY